jgi:pre-rRNA-processing protein TSR4
MSSELTEEEEAKRHAEETIIARLDSISILPDGGADDSNFGEDKETRTKEDDEASSSSSDDDENDDLEWDLGFLEEREDTTSLHAIYFPSKVGGKPEWLDPSVNPKQMVEANETKRRMDFLLQIYAANDVEDSLNTNAFHRTIYVFTSIDGDKVFEKGKVRAVRSQLARVNEFYGTTPAPRRGVRESDDLRVEEMIREFEAKKRAIETKVKMTLSGGNGSESKEEEEEMKMKMKMKTKTKNENENTVYPEFEIVVEPESDADEASCSSMDSEGVVADTNDDDNKKTSANTNKKKMFQSIGDEAITETDLKEIASGVIDSDAQRLATFSVKLAKFPDQVLRYCPAQNAKAMWPSKSLAPDDRNIPDCPRCRGKRRFEFQILPTIVSFIVPKESVELNDSSLDFGSIAVYTCSKSCALEGEYAEEYVLVHPPMNS